MVQYLLINLHIYTTSIDSSAYNQDASQGEGDIKPYLLNIAKPSTQTIGNVYLHIGLALKLSLDFDRYPTK